MMCVGWIGLTHVARTDRTGDGRSEDSVEGIYDGLPGHLPGQGCAAFVDEVDLLFNKSTTPLQASKNDQRRYT